MKLLRHLTFYESVMQGEPRSDPRFLGNHYDHIGHGKSIRLWHQRIHCKLSFMDNGTDSHGNELSCCSDRYPVVLGVKFVG